MTFLIIAKVDSNNRPTHINQKNTQIEADAIVSQLHTDGDKDAFAVETPHAYKDPRYMKADVVAKTVTYNQVEHDVANAKELALNTLCALESQETPRRLAEALPDDAGGSADGRAWLKANRDKIILERAKL